MKLIITHHIDSGFTKNESLGITNIETNTDIAMRAFHDFLQITTFVSFFIFDETLKACCL
ncbi:Uncharacterised protein [Mycobacterium tuberculosis]|nr:Uncharacterised protein [Mycobacterium tuberculosis]